MKLLRTIDFDLLSPEQRETLVFRQAARAVVRDQENNVALLQVRRKGYYKLPGGGVEPGEDMQTALKRECLEEIGCAVEVDAEIGSTLEYRAKNNVKQESFAYLAHVVGTKGEPSLTPEEAADGFMTIWVPITTAIQLVHETNTEDYQGQFIIPRELVILEEAVQLLSNLKK